MLPNSVKEHARGCRWTYATDISVFYPVLSLFLELFLCRQFLESLHFVLESRFGGIHDLVGLVPELFELLESLSLLPRFGFHHFLHCSGVDTFLLLLEGFHHLLGDR